MPPLDPQATQKILDHFIKLLQPFTLSINTPLTSLQSDQLVPLKPLFDFLRRHSARQAHEFQKAYVSTVRWYYETGFRRYVRGLEKLRLRGIDKAEPIGVVSLGTDEALGESGWEARTRARARADGRLVFLSASQQKEHASLESVERFEWQVSRTGSDRFLAVERSERDHNHHRTAKRRREYAPFGLLEDEFDR